MKNCPKCKAQIQENARFCLYCMTSFEEKQNVDIKKENKPWFIYIVVAVLLAVLIGFIGYYFLGNGEKGDIGNLNTERVNGTETASSNETNYSVPNGNSGQAGQNPYYSYSSGNYTPSGSHGGYQSEYNGPSSAQGSNGGNNNSSSNISSGSTVVSSDKDPSSQFSSSESSSENSSVVSSNSTKPSTASVSYSYRAAKYGDDYNSYATIPENAIVITKVNTASSNGVYEIPSSIDGKPVIAIMENAFGDAAVKNTVKTVIIPASIKTIWSYGFFYCNNLKEIYIKGEALFIGDSPFPPVQRRTETITIYCSATCHNRNFTKWKNIAAYNNAEYREWNG